MLIKDCEKIEDDGTFVLYKNTEEPPCFAVAKEYDDEGPLYLTTNEKLAKAYYQGCLSGYRLKR